MSSVGAFDMAYDANGNLIRRETVANNQTRQLIWDEENRLACTREGQNSTLPQVPASCGVAGSSNAPKFVYNAAGTRVVKDAGPKAITVNQNYSENGNKAYKHIFIGTQRLLTKAVNTNNKPETTQWFYHSDHLSSSSHTTNAEGKLNEHLAYFPYGETWVHENPSMPIQYGFTAKELDAETGYYYFGARYYDPRVSTWVSTDPALGSFIPASEQTLHIQPLLPFGLHHNDEKQFKPEDLPGHGGVFNLV